MYVKKYYNLNRVVLCLISEDEFVSLDDVYYIRRFLRGFFDWATSQQSAGLGQLPLVFDMADKAQRL